MTVLLLACTLLSGIASGCIGGIGGMAKTSEQSIEVPQWQVGQWWMYVFSTPQYGDTTTTLVVAETDAEDGTAYMLGIDSQSEARKHAVLNFNPFLGRISRDNLSVFEGGAPQQVFSFPLEKGNQWQFSLFGHDGWDAEVLDVSSGIAVVTALSSSGGKITYTFDAEMGFLSSFYWNDAEGTTQMQMSSAERRGSAFTGVAYFVRATDLFDETYGGLDSEIYDTFFDSGHPSDGEFDHLVWYLDVEISSGGQGTLTLKDHSGVTPLARVWGPSSSEGSTIGTIPSNSGEYSITLTLSGSSSRVHLMIAGGLETVWEM